MKVIPPTGGGVTILIICGIFLPLAILSVILRISSRRINKKPLELNDYLAILALLFCLGNTTVTILAVVYAGVGYHQLDVLPQAELLAQYAFALAIIWTFANAFVKLSILHLYTKIFRGRAFIIATYVTMGLAVAYLLINFFQILFLCQPVAYNWDKLIVDGHCTTSQAPYLSSALLHMFIDIIIVILPMPVVWQLQMKTSKKISISLIFGIGLLICVLSAVRVDSIRNLDYLDFSYSVVPDAIYSVLEPCLGIINCCLPIMQPIASKIGKSAVFSRLRSTLQGRSSRKTTENTADSSYSKYQKKFVQINDGSSQISDDTRYPLTNMSDGSDGDRHGNGISVSQSWTVKSGASHNVQGRPNNDW